MGITGIATLAYLLMFTGAGRMWVEEVPGTFSPWESPELLPLLTCLCSLELDECGSKKFQEPSHHGNHRNCYPCLLAYVHWSWTNVGRRSSRNLLTMGITGIATLAYLLMFTGAGRMWVEEVP